MKKIPPLTKIRGEIRMSYSTVPPCLRPEAPLVNAVTGVPRSGLPGRLGSGTAAFLRRTLSANVSLSERFQRVLLRQSHFDESIICPGEKNVKREDLVSPNPVDGDARSKRKTLLDGHPDTAVSG